MTLAARRDDTPLKGVVCMSKTVETCLLQLSNSSNRRKEPNE